jgi:Fe-S oxidoreductase
MVSLSKELEEELIKCGRCGFCRAYCPVFEYKHRESWNARGRLILVKALLDGKLSISEELLDRIYSCTLCKTCDETCPPMVKGSEIIKSIRTSLAEKGIGPLEGHREMAKAIHNSGSVLGKKIPLIDVAPSVKTLPDTAPNLIFAGCVVSSNYPNVLEALIRILKEAGMDLTVIKNGEDCCGKFLDLVGLGEEVSKLVEKDWKIFDEMKARNIIAICPFCYSAFLHSIPKGRNFSVQHSTELLLSLLKEGKISFKRKIDATVAYFDSCHLGRYEKIYEAPRSLIKAIPGIRLVEMDKSEQLSRCCGGTIRVPYYDIRSGMSEAIAKSAKDAGAEYLVTACPTCHHNLKVVAYDYDLKVCNIEELIAYSMGLIEELPEW